MTSSFKSKTEKFVSDIQSDLRQSKPILKHSNDSKITDSDEPRTYREESRVSEHGNINIIFLGLKNKFRVCIKHTCHISLRSACNLKMSVKYIVHE